MKKIIVLVAVALLAPGCAAVKGWLANGPEIEFSAGIGPAKLGLTLNPGKTLGDAAGLLASAAESVVPTGASVEAASSPAPLPAPTTGE